jgi:hypothetical protein
MGRADSNGNGASIPRGIREPEENFGRANERLVGVELCSYFSAQNELSGFYRSRDPSAKLAHFALSPLPQGTFGTQKLFVCLNSPAKAT